jgi:isopentenyldiphosphate isomerase
MDEPEMFDVVDAAGQALGYAAPRDEVHRLGLWHRSAHVWIFTGDGLLLFQLRAADKDTWPGRLDSSIGGHYRAGEGPAGVVREAFEELGIVVALEELIPIGVRSVSSVEPGITDNELQDIYLLRRDMPLAAYRPDTVELDGVALLDGAAAVTLHDGMVQEIKAAFLPRDGTKVVTRSFTVDDVIPDRGAYIRAVARAVGDVLVGRPPRRLEDL